MAGTNMKKLLSVLIAIIFCMSLISCGNIKAIDGKVYDTYGLFSAHYNRNPNIEYRVIVGNIFWSVILVQTIVAPIYFIGFSLFEPVCKKSGTKNDYGVIGTI